MDCQKYECLLCASWRWFDEPRRIIEKSWFGDVIDIARHNNSSDHTRSLSIG